MAKTYRFSDSFESSKKDHRRNNLNIKSKTKARRFEEELERAQEEHNSGYSRRA